MKQHSFVDEFVVGSGVFSHIVVLHSNDLNWRIAESHKSLPKVVERFLFNFEVVEKKVVPELSKFCCDYQSIVEYDKSGAYNFILPLNMLHSTASVL